MYKIVAMALHINNPATDKLARELAEETGESLTVAVNKALKERLERVGSRKREDREEFVAKLLAIAKQAKGLRKLKKSSRELIEELYDEDGLPR
jgi:antitoxin VapB